MANLKEAFGLRLKMIRKSKKYTQEELAEMLDLSPRQIIRIENGENFPSAETLGKLSLILNIRLKDLFNFGWNSLLEFEKERYNKPSIKVTTKGDEVIIKQIVNFSDNNNDLILPKTLKIKEYKNHIFKMCQKINKPIIAEFFNNKKRVAIKVFSPEGKIEELLSEKDIIKNEQYNTILTKLEKISSNIEQLNYVEIAIDSIKDNESLDKLKVLIQGMDLRK